MDGQLRDQIYQLHAQICRALADPKRLLIINELRAGERSVGNLAATLEVSQANASQHLAVLREKRLVTTRRDGSTVFYALASEKIVQAFDLLREVMRDLVAEQAAHTRALAQGLADSARASAPAAGRPSRSGTRQTSGTAGSPTSGPAARRTAQRATARASGPAAAQPHGPPD